MISFLVSSFFFTPHTLIHYNTHIHPPSTRDGKPSLRKVASKSFSNIHTLFWTLTHNNTLTQGEF